MTNATHPQIFSKAVHVEADIPVSHGDEFERAVIEFVAGERPRMGALDRDLAQIKFKAEAALQAIEAAINDHPMTDTRLTSPRPVKQRA